MRTQIDGTCYSAGINAVLIQRNDTYHKASNNNNRNMIPVRINKRRRLLSRFFFLVTTAFIWIVPWLIIHLVNGNTLKPVSHNYNSNSPQNDTLTNAELRKYLKMYNQGSSSTSTSILPKSTSTVMPLAALLNRNRLKQTQTPINNSNNNNNNKFPTSTQRSSFIPTEVMEPSSSSTLSPISSSSNVLPNPITSNNNENNAEVIQTLALLNSLLGTNTSADDISAALLGGSGGTFSSTTPLTTTTTTNANSPDSVTMTFDESLQALTLLNSLLGNNGNPNQIAEASTNNPVVTNLGSSSNSALVTLDAHDPSSIKTRQANQLGLGDPLTSSLTNLIFGGNANSKQNNNNNRQTFQNFQNSAAQMDASSSNQLTGLLGLLNTLGQFGGSSQGSSLFNFGQAPPAQPNYLSTLFNSGGGSSSGSTATTAAPVRASDYLSLLFGGGSAGQNTQQQQQIPQSPTITGTNDFLASLLNGGTPKQGQADSNANLLSAFLGSGNSLQSDASANLLAGLLGAGQQQSPSLLGSLGTGLFSLAGNALNGLNAAREGRPRVRGMDTRVGLGYRFGPNADAQVIWELGPQLFTEPLTNEQREAILAQREKQARQQLEAQQHQLMTVQQQLQELQDRQNMEELARLNAAASAASSIVTAKSQDEKDALQEEASNHQQQQLVRHLRRTNKRNHPQQTLTDILFGPTPSLSTSMAIEPKSTVVPPPRPRPKQNGVSSFHQRPNAGAVGKNSKRTNGHHDPYSMLTAYEKNLLKQSSLLGQQESSIVSQVPNSLAKRGPVVGGQRHPHLRKLPLQIRPSPGKNMVAHATGNPPLKRPYPIPRQVPINHKMGQFIFSPVTTSVTKTLRNGLQVPKKIAQMRQRRPQPQPAQIQMQQQQQFSRRRAPLPPSMTPMMRNHGTPNNFQSRLGLPDFSPPRPISTAPFGFIPLPDFNQPAPRRRFARNAPPNEINNFSGEYSKGLMLKQSVATTKVQAKSAGMTSATASRAPKRRNMPRRRIGLPQLPNFNPTQFYKRRSPPPQTLRSPPMSQPQTQIQLGNTFQNQNSVSEAEDSFLKRNAIAYNPMIREIELKKERLSYQNNPNRRTILDMGEDGMPTMIHHLRPSANAVFGMINRLTSGDNPISKLIHGETTPTPDKMIPPDSLDTFNCYFCNGEYTPTKQPPIIAKPDPTTERPPTRLLPNLSLGLPNRVVSTLVNTMSMITRGRDNSTSSSNANGQEEEDSSVKIFGSLTQEQFEALFSDPDSPDTKIKYQDDKMLDLLPSAAAAATTTTTPSPPLNNIPLEMFIDIESGEVSVRKSIGHLAGFGEEEEFATSSTPRIKTEEELEAEESQKIFEQVQEYLFNSYEDMKFTKELEKEVQKHKEKLTSGKDEMSHGVVSQYFNVLRKRVGAPVPGLRRPPVKKVNGGVVGNTLRRRRHPNPNLLSRIAG